MKAKTLSSCILLLAVAACQQMTSTAQAAVTFSVTPSAVSNFYAGPITLQVGGLNSGETVQVDKFLDANGNGAIDGADLPVQSFRLTDGRASVFYDGATAVTNVNVPGDVTPTNGAITAQLRIASDIAQQIVAQYIFRLSSPTSRFTPQTTLFSVTNSAYNKFFTGAVQSGGTNVPNAVVMVVRGDGRHGGPFAGVMANNTGNYTLNLPGGTYSFWLVKSNFVADLSKSPTLTLTNGATFTTNLSFLVPATTSVSGRVVDAANTNTGLPDVFMLCQTPDGQYLAGACYTGANGAFTVPVIPGQWEVMMDSEGLAAYGYLGLNDHPQVDTTTGSVSSVTLALPKATALFYGSVFDNQGLPLAGIYVLCQDNNDQYVMDYRTDANGYFVAPAVGGLSNYLWRLEVDGDTAPANYLFAQPAFNQNGGTNLNAGQALLVNLTGVLATNHISGYFNDGSGNPVTGIGMRAYATINGVDYWQGTVDTDSSGYYSLNVGNGIWTVGTCLCDSLASNYLWPSDQSVVVSNNNAVVNFTAILASNYISGHVQESNGNPIGGVGVEADATINGTGYMQYTDTDANGNYSLNVANGNWTVGLNPSSGSDSLDNILGSGTYQFPDNQDVNINNNNGVVNFTVQPLVSPGPDVVDYYVLKLEAFIQVDPVNFVLNTNFGPFNAYLGLVQSTLRAVPIANVTLPGGSARALPSSSSGLELETHESFPNQSAIDAVYPPGSYAFNLYTLHDGPQFPVLSMPSAAYPNPPHVSNFAAAQAISPLSPFTLQWESIPGATTNDSLWVFATEIGGNMVFSTPKPSTDRLAALNGTATSVVIPTNTFQPGHAYMGWIMFSHTTSLNTTEYPGAAGVTVVAAMTSFPLALASSSLPALSQPTRISSTQFGILLSGVPGQNYTVLVSTNAARPLTNWATLLITNLSASPALIQDNQATNKQRFYRVKAGP